MTLSVHPAQVLYVGDHVYGDVLASKKSLGWRTMLVVPELAHEVNVAEKLSEVPEELYWLRVQRDELQHELESLTWNPSNGELSAEDKDRVDELRDQVARARREHREKLKQYHESFHPIWGQLLKTGYQNSRFASQIERFACLYSSHATNLIAYSPFRSFRGIEDTLPHEQAINKKLT